MKTPIINGGMLDALRGILATVGLDGRRIDDVVAVANGTKVAISPADSSRIFAKRELEKPVTREELARLLGCGVHTVDYHARRGRLVRVRIPGSSRCLGFSRASVRAWLDATTGVEVAK